MTDRAAPGRTVCVVIGLPRAGKSPLESSRP